jgi:lysophospholipase L1-like esterase
MPATSGQGPTFRVEFARSLAAGRLVLETSREYYVIVYNLGISSNTSRHVLERYRREVDARNPNDGTELFIVFAVGVNDSAVTTRTDDSLVERGAYDTNMRELASLARQDADGRVLIVGPTPIDEALTKPIPYGQSGNTGRNSSKRTTTSRAEPPRTRACASSTSSTDSAP